MNARESQGLRLNLDMLDASRQLKSQQLLDEASRTTYNGVLLEGGTYPLVRVSHNKSIRIRNIGGAYGKGDTVQFTLPSGSNLGILVKREGDRRIHG